MSSNSPLAARVAQPTFWCVLALFALGACVGTASGGRERPSAKPDPGKPVADASRPGTPDAAAPGRPPMNGPGPGPAADASSSPDPTPSADAASPGPGRDAGRDAGAGSDAVIVPGPAGPSVFAQDFEKL